PALSALGSLSAALSWSTTTPASIATLSLHDALPISLVALEERDRHANAQPHPRIVQPRINRPPACAIRRERIALLPLDKDLYPRSEEHTSELQSRENLLCRLLLEKKNNTTRVHDRPD